MPLFSAGRHHLGATPEGWQHGAADKALHKSSGSCLAQLGTIDTTHPERRIGKRSGGVCVGDGSV
jgi:hypothetical protein